MKKTNLVAIDPATPVRECRKCGEIKPATADFFHTYRTSADNKSLRRTCKECRRKQSGKNYKTRRPRINDNSPEGMKICRACYEPKPHDQFGNYTRNADGLQSYCKSCKRALSNEAQKRIRETDWARRILQYVRTAYAGAKRRKKVLEWEPTDITTEFLWSLLKEQGGKCYWTGVTLSLEEMGKPWSVSLDRIDCDRGYLQGNVALVCKATNLARNDSSPDDMRTFIELIKRS